MKAFQYTEQTDDLSKAKITDVPAPTAKPGYAVVKIDTAAGNPIDYMVMGGMVPWDMSYPFTMGYDFSGTVTSIEGSDDFAVGDEVFAVNWGTGAHHDGENPTAGAFAEYIAIPVSKLSKKPADVSHEKAAAVALVGTTAYQILFDCAGVKKGDKVLILGGASSVGALAIQLAHNAGAWVATTVSTRGKEYVESFNAADMLINYNEKKWEEELKEVDAVIDTVGEKDGFERAKKILKPDGAFVSISSPDAGYDPKGHPPYKFASFYCLGNSSKVQDELVSCLGSGKLKINIESTYPFTDEGVQNLLANIKGGKSKGKHLLKIGA